MSHAAKIVELPQQSRRNVYSIGYRNGLSAGERFANITHFWLGVASGILLCAFVGLAVFLVASYA